MIQINVSVNAKPAIDLLTNLEKKQVPFAMAQALTRTAQRVANEEKREILGVYDRPTPYIVNAVAITSATKTSLKATIFLKDKTGRVPQVKYLYPNVLSGLRGEKPYEKALASIGALPPGWVTVPGEGAKLDAYGNISRAQLKQILAYFQAFPNAAKNTTDLRRAKLAKGSKKRQGFAFFVGRPGGGRLPLGVWGRYGTAGFLKPILIFVPSANYKAIEKFYEVARQTVQRDFSRQFDASMREALATAK